jgi:hypothetical protein
MPVKVNGDTGEPHTIAARDCIRCRAGHRNRGQLPSKSGEENKDAAMSLPQNAPAFQKQLTEQWNE